MRRFPRPFPLDNDTAPKNGPGIPEAGHKPSRTRATRRKRRPAYASPGGAAYASPGGAAYASPGGAAYASPGGPACASLGEAVSPVMVAFTLGAQVSHGIASLRE
jgi:hypothetical protein